MIISLALIWLSFKLHSIIPLVFLLVTWIPDVVLTTFIYALIDDLLGKRRKYVPKRK